MSVASGRIVGKYVEVNGEMVYAIHLPELSGAETMAIRTDGFEGKYVRVGDDWVYAAALIDGSGNLLDPSGRHGFTLVDDFMTGNNTTGQIGALGWLFTGGTVTLLDAEAGHPGLLRRSTGTTINSHSSLYLRNSLSAGPVIPTDTFDVTFIVRLNTNDTNTIVRAGLGNNIATITPNDGIYIEKLAADTSWFGVTRAASTESRTAALASVSTGWVALRVRRVDASTIGFSVDGGTEVTATTNITTTDLMPGLLISNTAAADKTIDIDYFALTVSGLTR